MTHEVTGALPCGRMVIRRMAPSSRPPQSRTAKLVDTRPTVEIIGSGGDRLITRVDAAAKTERIGHEQGAQAGTAW